MSKTGGPRLVVVHGAACLGAGLCTGCSLWCRGIWQVALRSELDILQEVGTVLHVDVGCFHFSI